MSLLTAILATAPIIIVNPPRVVIGTEQDDAAATWKIIGEQVEQAPSGKALRPGDVILRQRLVPKVLAVVSEDIVRSDGKDRWAAAGDQLFGAKVGALDAYCVVKSKINVTLGMFILPTTQRLLKQDCFVDSDGDSKLDQRFEADPGIGVLPNVARSEPQAFYPLVPVAYQVIDPAKFADESWVELQFRGGGGKNSKRPEMRLRYRYDGKTRNISQQYLGGDSFPSNAYLLGAEIEFAQADGGNLNATVKRPMDAGFGVTTALVSF
jgi:hypothetical protein